MSSDSERNRVGSLLSKVDGFIQANNLSQAAEALKEASRLDAQNPEVRDKWIALHNRGGDGEDILELLRKCIASDNDVDLQIALQALRQRPLSQSDAAQAVELLLHAKQDDKKLDSLTSTLISSSIESRKAIASQIAAKPTATFELLHERGDATLAAFAAIPVDDSLWSSRKQQITVQKDVFQLCIADLIRPAAEHLDALMACTARLLALAPDNVAPLVDEDILDAVFSSLDIRLPVSLRSQATLAASKLLEATKERGEQLFSDFITRKAAKATNDDLIVVFSAAAAVFPVIPIVAARLFLIDGFVQRLVPNLERNWEDGQAGKRKSHSLEIAALELLSAACVDSACREAIKRYCAGWLENLVEERKGEHKAIAALVLAKIGTEPDDDDDDITAKLEELILDNDHESDQAIEGLAYTSLRPTAKEEIVRNDKLVKRLVMALKERPTVTFGCLTIFSNLTMYRPNLSEEQKKMSQLKAYANSSKPIPDDPLDATDKVTLRCQKVLDADLVPALVECSKRITSPTNIALVINVLLSLARESKHRTKMAQQGAVRLLLQAQSRVAKLPNARKEGSAIERNAAHALARMLISLNPDHIFSSALPASNAVSALVLLLSHDPDQEQRDLLPTFEALLALTNLASMEEDTIRDLEMRLVWSQLEDQLLLSSNKLVQRASMELVCNLMASPTCVAKFVGDGSRREAARMQILLALTDAKDLPTRRAAGGALAMLTEWDAAVTAILDQNKAGEPNSVKALLTMCADSSDEMKHRGLVCVANVVNTPGEVGKRGLEAIKQANGKEILQEALKKTQSREILNIGVDVLKKLM